MAAAGATPQTWQECAATWKQRYPKAEHQAEYFLLKFKVDGVSSDAVYKLLFQFKQFDTSESGELEEDQALRLLEMRGETKTFKEMRAMVAEIDLDRNRKLSFLEWCCAVFKKSWQVLHTPSGDPAEVDKLNALASEFAKWKLNADANLQKMMAEEQAKLALLDDVYKRKKELEEKEKIHDEERKKREEEEKKKREDEEAAKKAKLAQGGAKGKAAMFEFAAEKTVDKTMDSAARIKHEAEERKKQKELDTERLKNDEESKRLEEEAKRSREERARAEKEAEEAKKKAEQVEADRIKAERAKQEKEAYEAEKVAKEKKEREEKEKKEKEEAERRARLQAKAAKFEGK